MRSDQETAERKQCKYNMHEVFLITLVVIGVRIVISRVKFFIFQI